MVKDFLYDLFKGPTYFFNANFWAKLSLPWVGIRPTWAMRLKFLRDTQLKFTKKSKLRLLDFETLTYIQMHTPYFKKQILKENKTEEKKLLKKSWLSFYPHEVTMIKIENSQNETITSEVFHGGPYRGASVKQLRKEINTLCFKARKRGLSIEEIQIIHTHPAIEAIISDEKDSSFIFNGLSKSDIHLAQNMAPFLNYPLRIKAITTAANYSMLF